MRPAHQFHVVSAVPDSLRPLEPLARNLRWVWDRDLATLFDPLDGTRDRRPWRVTGQHPVDLVRRTSAGCWDELAGNDDYVAHVGRAVQRSAQADAPPGDPGHRPTWFDSRHGSGGDGSPLDLVAYFSPEFGITEALPQYSGGLGVLAGDHLKASSDLGVPLVGVGLLYAEGYFHQALDDDGWQEEHNERIDPGGLGLTPTGVRVSVDLAGVTTRVQVWRVDVGRIPLYLLDTNVPGNPPEAVAVTDRLYGGDEEHRLRQEIVLGIGGVRALRALGLRPTAFHMNEGHAGFLGLERVREWIDRGLSFGEAVEAVRAGTVFTTHTPVPAGIDRFPDTLFERYFASFAESCGVDIARIVDLGQSPDESSGAFNMAVMGLRLAARRNGVARLHGAVSRAMFSALWPELTPGETPIGHVTNGVHARSWVSDGVDELLTDALGDDWHLADADTWRRVHQIDPARIWRVRNAGRAELARYLGSRLDTEQVLDPDILTIGFARRFATYKRATLLLSQPDRLQALLTDADRPVQLVFAGKAHPADQPGKALIQQIHHFAREAGVEDRLVFVPDYDIGIARAMYHGCDVWLNTPRRPLEACGTSGMKAALNGVLNCSIRDGWWDEMSTGDNGWDIPFFDDEPDPSRRDRREADAAFAVLEDEVVPLFHDRADGVPHGWVERIATNWSTLGWNVTAARMVRQYVEELYEPAARAVREVGADGAGARALAAWRSRVDDAWDGVRVEIEPQSVSGEGPVGATRSVTVHVDPGRLGHDELTVQLVYGPLGSDGEFDEERTTVQELETTGTGTYTYSFVTPTAGTWGLTARALPTHPGLASPYETGLAATG